jgi:SET domain-containing protein
MAPKSWPKRATYGRESVGAEMNLSLLQQFLHTGNPEDQQKSSWVIENRTVYPHLQIKKITCSLKEHPLANQNTKAGHPNYGLFATAKIQAGTEIGEYVGEISIVDPRVLTSLASRSEYLWIVTVNQLFLKIDAQRIANELSLINDYRCLAVKPNVKMSPFIHKGIYYFGYVSISDIQKGEELLVDYGEDFQSLLRGQ